MREKSQKDEQKNEETLFSVKRMEKVFRNRIPYMLGTTNWSYKSSLEESDLGVEESETLIWYYQSDDANLATVEMTITKITQLILFNHRITSGIFWICQHDHLL